MRRWGKTASPWLRQLALGALVATLGLVGCQKAVAPPATTKEQTTKPDQDAGAKQPAGVENAPAPTLLERDRLHQSFADAVRDGNDPPPDEDRPPDMTMTGTPTF